LTGRRAVNGRDPPAALELACTVFAAYRRRGYAREAVAGLVDWARSVHGIRRFLASIAPGNEPSTRVVTSIGFFDAGQRWDDEDGLALVFELDAPRSSAREARNRRSSRVEASC
jgi:[ribosomal protein S5]-alanine N-acetyltransferase